MEYKKISVIIPTCDRPLELRECLYSLSKQRYPKDKAEIIVVDDGIKKISSICLDEYKELRINYLSQSHKGPAAARNLGIRKSSGDIILFIGDDILAHEDLLKSHNEFHCLHMQKNKGVLGHITWSDKIKITHFMRWLEKSGVQFDFLSLKDNMKTDFLHFYTSNISVKSSFLKEKKIFFNENFKFAAYEDIEFGFKLEREGFELYYISKAKAFHMHKIETLSYAKRMFKAGRSARLLEKVINKKMGKECGFFMILYKIYKAFFYYMAVFIIENRIYSEKIFAGFTENFYALGYLTGKEKNE
ncbi:MAG: glycosyltransferase [Elusimicrobiota bacterium]